MRKPSARPRLLYVFTAAVSPWTFCRGMLAWMRERGFDVYLAAGPGEFLDETCAREGVQPVPVRMKREPAPLRDMVSLGAMLRAVARVRPDIIHYNTPKAGLIAALASTALGVPVRVFTLRGMRAEGLGGIKARALLTMERFSCAAAHRVLPVSRSLLRRAVELGLVGPARAAVLADGSSAGVDAERFAPSAEIAKRGRRLRDELGVPRDAPVVAFVGRLVRDKGVVELVRAHELVKRQFPEARLLVVGGSEKYNAVPASVSEKLASDASVVRTGFLRDTAPAYAAADLVVLPTYREGFPNVVLEASAMGLPVVATRVTGCVDAVVDGVTGTLVPARDAEALAGAMCAYLADPDLGRRHGAAGRERVLKSFRPERIWNALLDEYVRLLRAKGLPLPHSS